ncbi:MAG: hypothetical protein EOR69_28190 [Mesorhizobium sp.]|nr:MAG: hypothetical protein EOR69_28190 [Mesorhizobium sp.]RWL95291.1 MAG: hypothetical protein EOR70_22190 [Mesorhizobium sp.]
MVRFKERVRALTMRTRGASLVRIAKELSLYLKGWRGYFGFCETPSVLRSLDQWIRRRFRSIAWKQWTRGRTRFCGAASPGHRARTGGANRRQCARSLAHQQQPSARHCPAERFPRKHRPCLHRPCHCRITNRAALYGPVRRVVWEGRNREVPPYPDSLHKHKTLVVV